MQQFPAKVAIPTQALTQLNYVDVLQASAAIPGAFTPVQMNLGAVTPSLFVDGGVANNTPISMAIAAGADEVTVIFLEPAGGGGSSPPPRNLVDVAYACYDVMQQKILQDDCKLAAFTNTLLKSSTTSPEIQQRLAGKRQIPLYYVRPQAPLPVSVLDFSNQALINYAFALGLADGKTPQPFSV